jgi:hypothetical protein
VRVSRAAASPRKVRTVLVLDAKSWLEVYVAGELVAVEYHEPRRESSIGWVDRPRAAGGKLPELLLVVRRALAGKAGADAGELTATIAGRIARAA